MVEVEQWAEIRRLHFVRGLSMREISRRLGLHRDTVSRAIHADAPPAYRRAQRLLRPRTAGAPASRTARPSAPWTPLASALILNARLTSTTWVFEPTLCTAVPPTRPTRDGCARPRERAKAEAVRERTRAVRRAAAARRRAERERHQADEAREREAERAELARLRSENARLQQSRVAAARLLRA